MKALITGCNRGIGLELAKQLKAKGYEIYAICRTNSDELKTVSNHIFDNVDVTNFNQIKEISDKLKSTKFDLIINNAGVLLPTSLSDLNVENINTMFQVNAVAPLVLTQEFLGNLEEGSKVAMITSRMGSIEDNTSGGQYGYRMSKCALNIAGKSLAEDLKDKKIAVGLFHPGFVNTRMVNFNGQIDPDESAQGIVKQIEKLTMENSGGFWHSNGERLPW
ncbi:MAG: SDR family oxidoreductase [Bdellovibrionales bacterium]|nr:SDR family oxidoreductase [Bdellovibrionales bacterium]